MAAFNRAATRERAELCVSPLWREVLLTPRRVYRNFSHDNGFQWAAQKVLIERQDANAVEERHELGSPISGPDPVKKLVPEAKKEEGS